MARRVFLHIGLPKSGTTFIQTTMWGNRPRLREQGFLYPGSKRLDHYHASQVIREGSQAGGGPHADAWDSLVTALRDWPGDGLVSHEFFSMATAKQARRAVTELAPAEVEVVVPVRDYVRQFPAMWQEALKMNSFDSFDEFMARAWDDDLRGAWSWDSQDVPAVLRRWSKAVPADRIHVVTLPPPGAPRDLLWERWRTVVGIDDTGFDMAATFPNESLGAAQAALLHRVKPAFTGPLLEGPERHRWVRKYFGHEVLVPQAGARFGPRPEHVERLRERSQEAVRAIESGGYHVVGDLADLVPGDPTTAQPYPDDVADEELLDVAARAFDRMIQDVRDLTTERDRLRRQLNRSRPGTGRARLLRRLRRRPEEDR